MFSSYQNKQNSIKELFANCHDADARYQRLIQLGKQLPTLKEINKIPENLVSGCQSTMYLSSYLHEGRVFFEAESDALISAGLAALLIHVYSGEIAEVILKFPPDYIQELGIPASLTPSRANGLYSMHLHMKRKALGHLLNS